MYQDVKFIRGILYYEERDGNWYPVPLPGSISGRNGRRGPQGPTGPQGPAGSGFNFSVNIESDGVEGSGDAQMTLTAIPMIGGIPDNPINYTYKWDIVARNTITASSGVNSIGRADIQFLGSDTTQTFTPINNSSENIGVGMARVIVTHILTGVVQMAEYFVALDVQPV